MTIISPGLFLVMNRFPDRRNALRQLYRSSESFESLCLNYQKCSDALAYWGKSESAQASDRHQEYSELLQELELEIIQSLENGIQQ
jgi:hypothetical protein